MQPERDWSDLCIVMKQKKRENRGILLFWYKKQASPFYVTESAAASFTEEFCVGWYLTDVQNEIVFLR